MALQGALASGYSNESQDTYDNYVTVLNYSGKGILLSIFPQYKSKEASCNAQCFIDKAASVKITIDGNASEICFNNVQINDYQIEEAMNNQAINFLSSLKIPFQTSLKVEIKGDECFYEISETPYVAWVSFYCNVLYAKET